MLLVILVMIGIIILFSVQRDYTSHKATKISTSARSFSVFDDPYIYSYNGMAFYKLDIHSGETTILQTGLKLPHPDSIVWAGEKGALLTFGESFWLSEPQKLFLEDEGDITDSSYMEYTWYVDFETGRLHLASNEPLLRGLGYFSSEKSSIYFATQSSSANIALNSFDVEAHTNNIVADGIAVTDVSSLRECQLEDNKKTCLTARYRNNLSEATITSFNDDGESQVEFSTGGRLFSSNKGNYYVVFDRGVIDRREGRLASVDQADTTEEQATLLDIASGIEQELDYSSDSNNVLPFFTRDNTFFIFDNSLSDTNNTKYVSGIIEDEQVHTNIVRLEEDIDDPVLEFSLAHTVSSSSTLLVSDAMNDLLLLYEFDQIATPNQTNQADIERAIADCHTRNNDIDISFSESDNLYLIYLIENEQFYDAVSEISHCFTENNPRAMFKNSFYFGARDPHSGRITTD